MEQKHAEYFEGVLQLRNPSDEVLRFIRAQVSSKPGVFISKEKRIGDGIDFYMSSQHFLQNLGKKLKKRFTGELKVSRKLFTRNNLTSRDVYRVNVLFRVAKIKKGDKIKYKGEEYTVKSVAKKVFAVKDGKKICIDFKDIR